MRNKLKKTEMKLEIEKQKHAASGAAIAQATTDKIEKLKR